MSSIQTLLSDYAITNPSYNSNITFNNQLYITKLINSWTFYNDTITILDTIKTHPNYNASGVGSGSKLYDSSNNTMVIRPFKSIKLSNLYQLIYNKIALINLRSLNSSTYDINILGYIQTNYVTNIISDNNTFLSNIANFAPIFNSYNTSTSDKFYLLTTEETKFIKFIISVINYYINLINIDQISLTTFFENSIDVSAVATLYYNNFNITCSNSTSLVNYIYDITNFILPYVPIFNNFLPSYSIPNYYLGLCLFDYLRENKLTTLLEIALIDNVCSTTTHIFSTI
jgi:hypothetical protein